VTVVKLWTEMKSISKSWNAFYNSVQKLLSSIVLFKKVKIKTLRTIILPVVLCGCETWSLTLGEECRLRLFENRVVGVVLGPKKDEVKVKWRRLLNEDL
jgi:hypothetical protein